jgi:acetyltransferase
MRFRFLASRAELSEDDLSFLLNPDRRRAEHLLAFDTATGELVASLLLVADEGMESAEVAIATAQGWKAHGIGHALLKHAIELGSARGVKQLRSLEDRANCAALEVERTLGFQMHEVPGEPTLLMMETDLA